MDVISPGSFRRPRVRLDEVQSKIEQIKLKKVLDTLSNHQGCCDKVADSCCSHGADSCCHHATDTVSSSATGMMDYIGQGGGGSSMMIWMVAGVLIALAMCLYFVSVYRKRQALR